jgi:hypothetical protein
METFLKDKIDLNAKRISYDVNLNRELAGIRLDVDPNAV